MELLLCAPNRFGAYVYLLDRRPFEAIPVKLQILTDVIFHAHNRVNQVGKLARGMTKFATNSVVSSGKGLAIVLGDTDSRPGSHTAIRDEIVASLETVGAVF